MRLASWLGSRRSILLGGGKSGLRRVKCQVTPGGREPTESAAENTPPKQFTAGKVEMVR